MTTTALLPVPIFRAFDSAGNSLAGGLLYTYLANTTTPTTTWSDAAGTTPNANPVVLDSTGSASVRLDPAIYYKFVLKDSSGTTQWTEDYYQANYLTATTAGTLIWPQSAAEISASVTPTFYYYPWGDVRRYGAVADNSTNCQPAIQSAINQCNQTGAPVVFGAGTWRMTSGVTGGNQTKILGAGRRLTIINYAGSATAFGTNDSATRTYDWRVDSLSLVDVGTGTVGLDLRSVSQAYCNNLLIDGFDTSVLLTSAIGGGCVYNTFFDVIAANATTGFTVGAAGSNSNRFICGRTNVCTTGFNITDSNQNAIIDCQIESGGTGISITASASALSDRNTIIGNRFEGNATNNYNITSSNVRDTWISGNHHVTGTVVDSGLRSQKDDMFGQVFQRVAAQTAISTGAYIFERSANGGSSTPNMRVVDSATASGTPVTLQIETGRAAGKCISNLGSGSTEVSYMDATGRLMLTGAAPTVAASQVGFGATTATTVGAAGGASALPATPTGYLIINVAGTQFKLPYYAN
jgi:hypothetical protein